MPPSRGLHAHRHVAVSNSPELLIITQACAAALRHGSPALSLGLARCAMQTSSLTAESLARTLETFLLEAPHAVALENGELLFDFSTARYSVSGEGKCVLHVWSEERNIVRRVLDAEARPRLLRLSAAFRAIETRGARNQRRPPASAALPHCAPPARVYQKLLVRLLEREFPGDKIESISNRLTWNIR